MNAAMPVTVPVPVLDKTTVIVLLVPTVTAPKATVGDETVKIPTPGTRRTRRSDDA